jgi:hypothetical protein
MLQRSKHLFSLLSFVTGSYEVYNQFGWKQIGFEAVDWIHLAQNRNQWRTLVNTVVNHRVP